ncbi:hypothetical protein [Nostoc sp. CHAB 5836]|uniref:hypothetical protein n=1 Tax=Nostoc sp. CHAB 5836 TaxID=2780404 RepID=UPI001E29550E|nr:hypothetical protein [Nostoc sp. CHAB 5836]
MYSKVRCRNSFHWNIITKNPTKDVEVNGDRLDSAYRQLRPLQTSRQDLSKSVKINQTM